MAYVSEVNKSSGIYSISGFNNLYVNTEASNILSRTVAFDSYSSTQYPDENLVFKILFTNGVINSNDSDLTLNGKNIYVNIDGTLTKLKRYNFDSNYITLQANTILDLYYSSDNDGKFIVVGNPVIYSDDDFVIYADGTVEHEYFEAIAPTGELSTTSATLNITGYGSIQDGQKVKLKLNNGVRSSVATSYVNIVWTNKFDSTSVTKKLKISKNGSLKDVVSYVTTDTTYSNRIFDANIILDLVYDKKDDVWLLDNPITSVYYDSETLYIRMINSSSN